MNELLEIGRGEYEASKWFMDEEAGQTVNVSPEVAKPAFERFLEIRNFITATQSEIRMRFIGIGMALWELQREKLYRYVTPKGKIGEQGYSSFYDFCKDVFGLKKTTAANMVFVAQEYCGEDGALKLPYLNFSYTQLVEMLPMEEKYRLRIPVSLASRKIRALKEYYKENVPGETVEEDLKNYEEERRRKREEKNAKRNSITFIPAKMPQIENHQAPGDFGISTEQDEVKDFDGEDERDVITPNVQKPSFEAIREGLYMQLKLLRQAWEGKGKGVYAKWDTFCTHIEKALSVRFPDYIVPYNEAPESEETGEKSFEMLRDKILQAFEDLKELDPNWLHIGNLLKEALEYKNYSYLSKKELLSNSRKEIAKLAIENQSLKNQLDDNKLALENLKKEVQSGLSKPRAGKAASGKLSLKNKKEREEWLMNYESWGVWLSVPEVSKTFYRYDFENGCSLIVEVCTEYRWEYYLKNEDKYTPQAFWRYAIIDEKRPSYDSAFQGGFSGIVEWLSKHSKEI